MIYRHGRSVLRRLFRSLSVTGLLLATLFFAFSLTPSLVPRPPLVQGLISGLSFTAGYAIGVFGRWLWFYVELPSGPPRFVQVVKYLAGGVSVILLVNALWRVPQWQNSVRQLMGLEPIEGGQILLVMLATAGVFALLLLPARLFRLAFGSFSRHLQRDLPPHVANVMGVVLILAGSWSVLEGTVFRFALHSADNFFQQLDQLQEPQLAVPANAWQTGSTDSLVAWPQLGRQGRKFIATGPTAAEISEFLVEPALQPLRVYVGLNAAKTPGERAELALAELRRVGGFERSVLVIATPTGSGWVDPAALDTVEYLHQGDIATVAAQYSYLPSPLSLLVEPDYGQQAAAALFEAIYNHWTSLPRQSRPRLFLFGLSLGALNSDRSFELYDIIPDPFDGALWSGPPFRSETWQQATRERAPGSPAWLPVFRGGTVIRFINQNGGFERPDGPWGPFRIGYLQYASDPVTFFEPESLYRKPAWMDSPRGPDVSGELRWYPVVTMLQLAADMLAGAAPAGYGHHFAAEDYIEAWYGLTEPAEWTSERLARLKTRFRNQDIAAASAGPPQPQSVEGIGD